MFLQTPTAAETLPAGQARGAATCRERGKRVGPHVVQASLTCPTCGASSPEHANFCAHCGAPLAPGETPPPAPHEPVRRFGVLSPTGPFVLGCLLLAGALVALVAGSLVLGILLLAGAVALLVLSYGAAQRDPEAPVARRVLSARDRVRGWATFTTGTLDAWRKASRDVVRLRGELRSMRRDRREAVVELGEAAYRGDAEPTESLRTKVRELDAGIEERERAIAAALAHARRRVDDERRSIHPTEVLAPEEPAER